jgi:putative hydrolase of the HAD superfamily
MSRTMTSRHPVKLVCVDLGGVVVRIRRSLAETLHAVGVPGYLLESITAEEMAAFRATTSRHQRGECDWDQWLPEAHGVLRERVDADTIARAHDAILVGEYPGVARALGAIRKAGAVTACLSNTNDRHWSMLVELAAMGEIEHRHASHLLGHEKPNEAIFRAFETATGFAGDEILFLDDLEEHCAGARACGWSVVRIDHERDTAAQILAAARAHGVAA